MKLLFQTYTLPAGPKLFSYPKSSCPLAVFCGKNHEAGTQINFYMISSVVAPVNVVFVTSTQENFPWKGSWPHYCELCSCRVRLCLQTPIFINVIAPRKELPLFLSFVGRKVIYFCFPASHPHWFSFVTGPKGKANSLFFPNHPSRENNSSCVVPTLSTPLSPQGMHAGTQSKQCLYLQYSSFFLWRGCETAFFSVKSCVQLKNETDLLQKIMWGTKCILGTMFTSRATVLPLATISDIMSTRKNYCFACQCRQIFKKYFIPLLFSCGERQV